MFKNVVQALNEALDITTHLHPLLEHFQVIADTYKLAYQDTFFRGWTWQILVTSAHFFRHWCTPSAWCMPTASSTTPRPGSLSSCRSADSLYFPFLIFTLQETCNLLIDMARKFLDPSSIFQIEVGMHVLLSIFSPVIVRENKIYFDLFPIKHYFWESCNFGPFYPLFGFPLIIKSSLICLYIVLCHDTMPIHILLHTMNPKVEEALDMVKIAIRNMKEFKTCFQEYKIKLPSYFIDKPQKSWEFQVGSIIACISTNFILMTPIVTKLRREIDK